MNATDVYVVTANLVFRRRPEISQRRLVELSRRLQELRLLLSCVVCRKLVVDPYTPNSGNCQHNVCRLCIRGHKQLDPKCNNCNDRSDFKTYKENRQIGSLMHIYKIMCGYIESTNLYRKLAGFKSDLPPNFSSVPCIKLPYKLTQEIISEGSAYEDMVNAFAEDLPCPNPSALLNLSFSISEETPPTTAATTPDISDCQHLNDSIFRRNLREVELDAADINEYLPPSLPIVNSGAPPTGSIITLHQPTSVQGAHSSVTIPSQGNWVNVVELSEAIPITTVTNIHSDVPVIGNNRSFVTPVIKNDRPIITQNVSLQPKASADEKNHITQMPAECTQESLSLVTTTTTTTKNATKHLVELMPTTTNIMSVPTHTNLKRKRQCESATDDISTDVHDTATSNALKGMVLRTKRVQTVNESLSATNRRPIASTTPQTTQPGRPKSIIASTEKKMYSCRCGNASSGKLTCFGQRCPCYRTGRACIVCKCSGCRNPNTVETTKVTSTTTAAINSQVNQEDERETNQTVPTTTTPTITLIPLNTNNNNNEQFKQPIPQSRHPPVLVQTENGEYQIVNLYTKSGEPVNPANLGLQPIQFQSNIGGTNTISTAYLMPAEGVAPIPPAAATASTTAASSSAPATTTTANPRNVQLQELQQQQSSRLKQTKLSGLNDIEDTTSVKKSTFSSVDNVSLNSDSNESMNNFEHIHSQSLEDILSDTNM